MRGVRWRFEGFAADVAEGELDGAGGEWDGGDAGEFADGLGFGAEHGAGRRAGAPVRWKPVKVRWTLPRERMRSTISWPR